MSLADEDDKSSVASQLDQWMKVAAACYKSADSCGHIRVGEEGLYNSSLSLV